MAESLRKMAKLNPDAPRSRPRSLNGHREGTLEDTAKSPWTRPASRRVSSGSARNAANQPKYEFLVPKEQVASGGDKPWSKVSDHVWITGNTYVIKSKNTDGIFVLDPVGQEACRATGEAHEGREAWQSNSWRSATPITTTSTASTC
ncbi:MAG: hypothetical protein U0792_13880 [Gemmataceae bacterium]